MDILIQNSVWMTFNAALALIAVTTGWLTYLTKYPLLRLILGIVWILFLPNTIYIATDAIHLPQQLLQIALPLVPILILMYLAFFFYGITMYIIALLPLELMFKKMLGNNMSLLYSMILFANLIISFGIVLGRFYRIQSWEAITNSAHVLQIILSIMNTGNHMLFILLFSCMITLLYGTLRSPMLKRFKWYRV